MAVQKRSREDRLRLYGMDCRHSFADLELPQLKPGEKRTFEVSEKVPHGATIHQIRCCGLDHAKQVFGVANEVARKRRGPLYRCCQKQHFSVRELEQAVHRRTLTPAMSDFLLRTAEEYVYDDSTLVSQYKAVLEAVIPANSFDLKVAGWGNIYLYAGWTFSVPPDVNIIFADRLTMETGARVRRKFAPIKFDIAEIRQVEPQLPI